MMRCAWGVEGLTLSWVEVTSEVQQGKAGCCFETGRDW
jgi:hypothetical protein